MSRPRLLMVVHSLPSDVRVAREARAAVALGFDVDVLATRRSRRGGVPQLPGVTFTQLPLSHVRGAGLLGTALEYGAFALMSTVWTAVRATKTRYAVVQIHNPPDFLIVAGLLPKLLGARLIFDVHDLSDDMFAMRFGDRPGRHLAQRSLRSLERLAVRSADAVITVHEPYRRELIARGARPEKVRVVMNVVHTEIVPAMLREPARDAEGFRVVYHGTLTPHYGLETVLEAAALTASEIPDLRLELYGSGDARTMLEQQAAALGIDDRVAFLGAMPQHEVLRRVAGASVGLVPNSPTRLNRFALSSKLFEYVVLGVPVVSADLPTIRAHFTSDEVRFFRAGDARSLARALVAVWEDPEAAGERARAARLAYDAKYAWEKSAAEYERALTPSADAPRDEVAIAAPRGISPQTSGDHPVSITASTGVTFFDHFRIPYSVDPGCRTQLPAGVPEGYELFAVAETSRVVCWPGADAARETGDFSFADCRFRAPVATDSAVLPEMSRAANTWMRDLPVVNERGEWIASSWTDERGNVLLPFDPSRIVESFWTEEYLRQKGWTAVAQGLVMRHAYYRVKDVIPEDVRLQIRRALAVFQRRTSFPSWPADDSLERFYGRLLTITAQAAGGLVPWLAFWPSGFDWACVLTHDVESREGFAGVAALRSIERRYGYRSSWHFVPRRYDLHRQLLEQLQEEGDEVGVHGLYHDGYDLRLPHFHARVHEMARAAEDWGAVGFRSPSTLRDPEVVAHLPFAYDSSFPDTDPFEPQPGGCLALTPFFIGDVVELPITLPQDHTVFNVLRMRDEGLWRSKIGYLRDRGGLALMLTHPDYMRSSHRLEAYETVLCEVSEDPTAWRPLPRDVASWWRERRGSTPTWSGDHWVVAGSDRAQLRFAGPVAGGVNGALAEHA